MQRSRDQEAESLLSMATVDERLATICDVRVTRLSERYSALTSTSILGSGANATVHSATNLATGAKVAIKVLDAANLRDDSYYDSLCLEILALREVRSPRVVKLHEVVANEEVHLEVYIVMELLGGDELFTRVIERPPLDEDYAQMLFAQVGRSH